MPTKRNRCSLPTMSQPSTRSSLNLNASTRHIIGAKEFGKMKDGVVIVNTARGALIDEKALVAAIEAGKVSRY